MAQGYPINANPDVPQDLQTYTQSVFIELAGTLACQISGQNPINPNRKCLGVDSETNKIGFVENGGGLIGITGNMIAMTFQIPVSSTHYGSYLASKFNVPERAYAQGEDGVGFDELKPLLNLWVSFRNITYLIFVILFVIIGVAIMFRVKIDPRTVMTVQNQIPKIIIALVLVTLSYAIAGFLIDMMYVFMYLSYNIFAPTLGNNAGLNPVDLQGSNPITAVGALGGVKIAVHASSGIGHIIGSLFDGTYGKIIAGVVGALLGAGAGFAIPGVGPLLGGVFSIVGGVGGFLAGSKLFAIIGGIIAFLVIAIAILLALFRLWFALLKAYIFILISVVLAPLYIASGLIPGRSGFGAWIRTMVANLAVFPATLVMLLLGKTFVHAFGSFSPISGGSTSSSSNFVPPFIGNPGDPTNFAALIGLGIILLTPEVVTMVRDAIKAPEFKYTSAIGKGLQGGANFAGAPVGATWRNLTRVSAQGEGIGAISGFVSRRSPRLSSFLFGTRAGAGGGR